MHVRVVMRVHVWCLHSLVSELCAMAAAMEARPTSTDAPNGTFFVGRLHPQTPRPPHLQEPPPPIGRVYWRDWTRPLQKARTPTKDGHALSATPP